MKKPDQWLRDVKDRWEITPSDILAIQADALREAAEMCRKHDGLSIMAAGWIDRRAEQIEAESANDQAQAQPPTATPERKESEL